MVTYPVIIAFDRAGHGAGNLTEMVADYNYAQARVDLLKEELAVLQQRTKAQEGVAQENHRLRQMMDFRRGQPRLTFIAAEVLGIERGIVTIDRGSTNGIQEGMCALTKDGIVGSVIRVEPFTSFVASLHHPDCRIGVKIKRSRVRGVVRGTGSARSHLCELQYILESDDVLKGDEVVTGEWSIFPSGFPVGRVASVHGSQSLLRTAVIQPAVNLYALDELFIVESAAPERRDDPQGPGTVAATYTLPDTSTLQERLAP
jgi:rod shape-determining protein MreC